MLFIELWGEDSVQTQLEGAKHNKPVYERIAAELAKSGSNKAAEQCNSKIKKLKLEYRKECDKHNKTGQGRSKWRFFDALDGILGHRPTSQPTVLLDTSASAPSTNDSDIDSQEEGDNDQEEIPSVSGEPVESNEEIHTSTGAEIKLEQPSTSKSPIIKGKRKRSKEDKIESIMSSVVKEVVTAQQESDKIFLAHEEKRMKFEAEQRQSERDFQLRMMSLLFGPQSRGTPTPQYSPTPPLPYQYGGAYHPFPNPQFPPTPHDETP